MRFAFSVFLTLAATLSVLPNEAGRRGYPAIFAVAQTSLLSVFDWFGQFGIFCQRVLKATFTAPFEGREFLRQLDSIGSQSLPLVALAGSAIGVVLALQTRDSLTRFGAKSLLPSVIIYSLMKEMGPVVTGLIASGRVGAGIGAELGSMKVTEQIDAMVVSGVDPYKFLASTRVLACIVALPLLTLAADAAGVILGWLASSLAEPISLRLFLNIGLNGVMFSDFLPSTLKTSIFGFIIGAVSSFQGMRSHGGTAGVGRSATSAVVLSSLFLILADVFLVRLIIVFFG
jgi:phospholipid/cholesterol/gamma-HCH transport system permease protein